MRADSIAEQLFFTTVRVETFDANARPGTGTSFVFAYRKDGQDFPFLVTNKHVVKGAIRGTLTFLESHDDSLRLKDGEKLVVEDFEQLWHGHPDPDLDVCVTPLAPLLGHLRQTTGTEAFHRVIGSNLVPSASEGLDAIESVVFIGYPSGLWDTKNLLPILRRGTTATPIAVDFEQKPIFLIDAAVFPGSSGSPVLIYDAGVSYRRDGEVRAVPTNSRYGGFCRTDYNTTHRVRCIGGRRDQTGNLSALCRDHRLGLPETEFRADQTGPIPTARQLPIIKEAMDLGIVLKASTILEAIEDFLRQQAIV